MFNRRDARFAITAASLSFAAGLLAACGSSTSGGSSSGSGGSGKTIQLYYAGPLTAGANSVGVQGCQGMKLGASDVNATGGVTKGSLKGAKFSVKCIDNNSSADTTASIAAKYVSDPNVWALGGFYASGDALAAGIVAQRQNLPVIASNVAADFLTTKVHNIYVLLPRLAAAGGAAADFGNAYYGAKKAALLVPNFSFIADYARGANQALSADGVSLVSNQTWPDGQTTNWAAYWTKIGAAGADYALVGGYPPEQCKIAAQGRQQGNNQPIIDLTDSSTGDSCRKQAGAAYAGMIFGDLNPQNPPAGSLTEKAIKEFDGQYHTTMSYYAGNGYDTVLAVKYAIEAGAKSRDQLLKYLAQAKGPGVLGDIAFNGQRIGVRTLSFLEANKAGALEPVGSYTLYPNNSWKRRSVAKCASRPTCQTNLSKK